MKAKTIVGMMACAAFASAFADTINNNVATTNDQWFVGNVQSSALHADGAAWDNTAAKATVSGTKIEIDNDLSTALTLAPTTTNSKTAADLASDGLVILSATAYLTPSALADLPTLEALGDAQVGFAVAVDNNVTNYYAYTRNEDDNGTVTNGTWTALTGVNPPVTETDTAFKIALDYQDSIAKFYVGDTLLFTTNFTPVAAKLSNVAAFGSGTITSISGAYENAVAVGKDGKVYGTIAQAYNAPGEDPVVAWDPSTGEAAKGAAVYAANGLEKAVCMALNIAPDAKIALEPAAQNVENKVVLKTAVAPVDGVTALFTVSTLSGTSAGEGSYTASNIQIPLGTGTYQIIPTVSGTNP